jgi:hypothetical protein
MLYTQELTISCTSDIALVLSHGNSDKEILLLDFRMLSPAAEKDFLSIETKEEMHCESHN